MPNARGLELPKTLCRVSNESYLVDPEGYLGIVPRAAIISDVEYTD